MRNIILLIFIAIISGALFLSCERDEDLTEYCNCRKTVYISTPDGGIKTETYNIECEYYGDIDGYGGIGEDGNSYFIECDY